MRTTLSRHGYRTGVRRLALLTLLFVALGGAVIGLAARAAAAAMSVGVLSTNTWTDMTGGTSTLHLVAEVQNTDQRDASLVGVTFNLWDTSGHLIGPETATADGLAIVDQGGGRSPYAAHVPTPAHYDHATLLSVSAAAAPTPPDHNFTIVSTPCTDVVDQQHLCGTITNNNSITVAGVRIIFTFYSDTGKTQVADDEAYSLPTNGTSSLAAGAATDFEVVRSPGPPNWLAMTSIAESSTTTPAAPIDAFATAHNASATVSWSAPPRGDLPVTSYTVTSAPAGGTTTVAANQTSATVAGLRNGTTYTFSVTATNDYGTGPPSNPSEPVTPVSAPDAPVITGVTPADSAVTVSWSAPFNEGSPITRYTVTSNPPVAAVNVGGNTTTATVSGLSNGTSYTFTVTATNALGTGPPSSPSSPVTPARVPGAPTGVSATPGNGSATVSWTAPASNGGAPITRYTVTSSPDGVTATTPNGTVTTATISPLRNGTQYTFTVTAANATGSGAPSSQSNAVTPSVTSPPHPTFSTPWQTLGGRLATRPVASSLTASQVDAFATGTDGVLWHNSVDATGTSHWEPVPGQRPTSDVSAVSHGGTIDVFMRGSDLALWHNSSTGGPWAGWVRLGGRLASAPSTVVVGSNLDTFVQGTDGRLWLNQFDGNVGTWSLGEGRILGSPAAVAAGGGRFGAFVVGTDHSLWLWINPTTVGGSGTWTAFGGRVAGDPSAVSPTTGRLEAFVEGTDGGLWHLATTTGALSWSWEGLGGRLSSGPSAVTYGTRMDVFARGTDGALWHAGIDTTTTTGWSWEDLFGQLTAAPSAVSPSAGHLDVFIRSSDGSLWHRAAS